MTRTKTTVKTKTKAAPKAGKKPSVKKAVPKKAVAAKAVAPKKAKGSAARPVAKKAAPPASVARAKKPEKAPAVKVAVKTPVKAPKKDKDMTPREKRLQGIRSMLMRQKELLFKEAESALNELPGQTIFPDLGDQASAEIDRNFMLRLRGREQRLLKKIDEAIERIDNGTFGICDDCGNEIDIKRLEARPVTTMCIECKTLQEEEEKLREQ